MSTMEKQVVVLQSDCVCVDEDDTQLDSCYGCYDDEVENLKYLIQDWAEAQSIEFNEVRVKATGMGWQSLSGEATITVDKIATFLTIRGDFRITFTLDGESLSARRASHDEPTGGAHFVFEPIKMRDGE